MCICHLGGFPIMAVFCMPRLSNTTSGVYISLFSMLFFLNLYTYFTYT